MPTVSPVWRFFFDAVLVSITTPSGPGQLPLTSFSELNWGFDGLTLKPRFGAPPEVIALPLTTTCRLPETSPTASLTSGSASTRGSNDC